MVAKAAKHNMPAIALTDWGNLYGTLYLQKACKKQKENPVKAIYGLELGVTVESSGPFLRHMVLLAKNNEGFANLRKITSMAHRDFGFNDGQLVPQMPLEELLKHKESLIFLTGGLKGIVNSFIVQGQLTKAREVLNLLRDELSDEQLYLELQDSNLSFQHACNEQLIDWSKAWDIPLVATSDAHYLNKEDALAHEYWMMVEQKHSLEHNPRSSLGVDSFYLATPEEMNERFSYVPQALSNTLKIADNCNVELSFSDKEGRRIYHLPSFSDNDEEFFQKECKEGLQKRLSELKIKDAKKIAVYNERLNYEIKVISNMGFAGYYLIVSDFIRWAKKQEIPVGPGRGSGAGSLVAYCLDVTNLDPIENGLLFERFLNPERVSLPDFDIDFCQARRQEVIQYVAKKYGEDHVCQIVTFAKEQSKNAIKDVGRVMGMSFGETNRLTKLIPSVRMKPLTISESLAEVKELKDLYDGDSRIKQLLDLGQKLEGSLRQAGVHAAGVIIASKAIDQLAPVSLDVNGNIVTQWDMKMSEEAGLVKFDFLGLVTLDLMDLACKLVNKRHPKAKLKYDTIPVHDERSYNLIARGDTLGVFQFESSGMQNICIRIKPDCFEDLCAINALFRPGPLESGMVDDYIARKHGQSKVEYFFPEMESCLKESYGTIVYQEQVMEIARVVAGYTLGGADQLRRVMGKKIMSEMKEHRKLFVEGATEKGKEPAKAAELFDIIEKFAGYGFNKSHAAAYVMLAAQTAYLKAVYPVEFFAALLTIEKENTDKLAKYIVDAKKRGLNVLPPDVNESDSDFSIVGNQEIRFGLSAIKNVGISVVEKICLERKEHGAYKDLFDFVSRVDSKVLNKRTIESLIQAGAFDNIEGDIALDDDKSRARFRARYVGTLEKALEWATKENKIKLSGQTSLFAGSASEESLVRPQYTAGELLSHKELLDWEKQLMGIYVSGHPLGRFQNKIKKINHRPIKAFYDSSNLSGTQSVVAVVSSLREVKVRRGKWAGSPMGILKIEDLEAQMELVSFPEHYGQYVELFKSGEPILIKAELEYEEGMPKLLCSRPILDGQPSVEALAQIKERWPRKCRLELRIDRLEKANVSVAPLFTQIAELMKKYPGSVPFELCVRNFGEFETEIDLGNDFQIAPDDSLLNALESLSHVPESLKLNVEY